MDVILLSQNLEVALGEAQRSTNIIANQLKEQNQLIFSSNLG